MSQASRVRVAVSCLSSGTSFTWSMRITRGRLRTSSGGSTDSAFSGTWIQLMGTMPWRLWNLDSAGKRRPSVMCSWAS